MGKKVDIEKAMKEIIELRRKVPNDFYWDLFELLKKHNIDDIMKMPNFITEMAIRKCLETTRNLHFEYLACVKAEAMRAKGECYALIRGLPPKKKPCVSAKTTEKNQ